VKAEISECCKRLRLSRNIAAICEQVEADSHQEYLLQILKHEISYREANRMIIPVTFDPLVRPGRATRPEFESHYSVVRATF
jgi:hypothetical protein